MSRVSTIFSTRTRNYAKIASPEMNTYRTNNLGASELRSLGRGIYEQDDPTYSLREQNQERQILEVNQSVRQLVEVLDKKDNLLTEQNNED